MQITCPECDGRKMVTSKTVRNLSVNCYTCAGKGQVTPTQEMIDEALTPPKKTKKRGRPKTK